MAKRRVSGRFGVACLIGSIGFLAACGGNGDWGSADSGSAALTSIEVSPSDAAAPVGTSQQFAAMGTFSDGSTQDLTSSVSWSSSDPVSAAIAADGMGTALATGAVTISASRSGITGSAAFTLTDAALVSIAIAPDAATLAIGETQAFSATGTYTDGSTRDLTSEVLWSSSSEAVATIANGPGTGGRAVPIAPGDTSVGAQLGGIASPAAALTVVPKRLVSLSIEPGATTVFLGATRPFAAIGTFSDATTQDLTTSVAWTSSNAAVASLDADGLASTTAAGTSTIAASLDGISASATLHVTAATLVSIAVTPGASSRALGESQPFLAIGSFDDGNAADLTAEVVWSSSNPSVAAIASGGGAAGRAATLAVGSTNISAQQGAITSAAAALTVTPATLVSLSIEPGSATVPLGATRQFSAVGTFSDATTQDLTASVAWSSSNASVASIVAGGLASPIAEGTSTIGASHDGFSASATLEVTAAALVSLSVSPDEVSVALGESRAFTATGTFTDGDSRDLTSEVVWSSSNAAVATVASDGGSQGLATTLSVGSTNISAQQGSVASPAATLTVTEAELASLAVDPASVTVPLGREQPFTALGTYTDGSTRDLTQTVSWSASNPDAVSIFSDGFVYTYEVGSTTIQATLDGFSADATLTITEAVLDFLEIQPGSIGLKPEQTRQLIAIGYFSDGDAFDLTADVAWQSSNPSVASVGSGGASAGLLTAHQVGTTNITVSSGEIASSAATVSVTDPPLVSLALDPRNATMPLAGSRAFTATGTFADATTEDLTHLVSWSSSDTGVATISNADGSRGTATPVGLGATTITATLDGITNNTSLTVAANGWTATAPAPFDIAHPIPVGQNAAGHIFVMSPDDPAASLSYDPATSQWSLIPAPPFTNVHLVAVAPLPNDRVLVAGGQYYAFDDELQEEIFEQFDAAWIFDMNAGTWSQTTSRNDPRGGAISVPLSDGRVLVLGGIESSFSGPNLRDGEIYDPVAETWTTVGETSIDVFGDEYAVAALADGRVFLSRGATSETLDPATGTWSAAASPPTPRTRATATTLADGRVLLAGGYPLPFGAAQSSAEIFDPATNSWSGTNNLPSSKAGHAATRLPDGRVLISGGRSGFISSANGSSALYDPASGSWSNASGVMVRARGGHRLFTLPDGHVFAIGGTASGDDDADRIGEIWQ